VQFLYRRLRKKRLISEKIVSIRCGKKSEQKFSRIFDEFLKTDQRILFSFLEKIK